VRHTDFMQVEQIVQQTTDAGIIHTDNK
jgi:hypothetical protein